MKMKMALVVCFAGLQRFGHGDGSFVCSLCRWDMEDVSGVLQKVSTVPVPYIVLGRPARPALPAVFLLTGCSGEGQHPVEPVL